MSVQQPIGKRFTPNLIAMAVCIASSQAAFAADAQQPSAVVELGATQINTEQQLGGTTEGSHSYTTGQTSTATKLPLSLRETPQSVTVITRQQMSDQGLGHDWVKVIA